jgi:hypothetical protein
MIAKAATGASHEHRAAKKPGGRLATDLAKLNSMTTRARLEDVASLAAELLAGKLRGRVVIDL